MKKISELEKEYGTEHSFLNEDNHYHTIFVYGDENLDEMAQININERIPKLKMDIHVEGKEGPIPHIHLCKGSGKNIILRIRLDKNEYFREKDGKLNTLNSQECKALNKYMNEKVPFTDMTKWYFILSQWNLMNSSHMIDPHSIQQPDYKTILEPKKNK